LANSYGRFQSLDQGEPELENPQSLNRYAYTGNDPINYTDPTGKGFFSIFKKIAESNRLNLCSECFFFPCPSLRAWIHFERSGMRTDCAGNLVYSANSTEAQL
jgi:hypothetical protein